MTPVEQAQHAATAALDAQSTARTAAAVARARWERHRGEQNAIEALEAQGRYEAAVEAASAALRTVGQIAYDAYLAPQAGKSCGSTRAGRSPHGAAGPVPQGAAR